MRLRPATAKRLLVAISAIALLAAGLALAPGAAAQTADPGAVIDNGTVQLGVHDTAQLNFSCGSPGPGCPGPSLSGTGPVGLRFMQYNADGTAPGCLCEGWGAADAGSGLSGWENESSGSSGNLTVESFTHTASTAVSVVSISDGELPGYEMTVTHDYHPATGTPNLYEVLVTIENTGSLALSDVRYRRVMDWDVEPTAFDEWVTIQGTTGAENLRFDSDNGFASSDPLSGNSYLSSTAVCGSGYPGACDFTDLGAGAEYPDTTSPSDHGALFDFEFGALAPTESLSFRTFYGAAASEGAALAALGSQSVEIYSLGQPNCPAGPIDDGGDSTGCGGQPANSGVELGQPVTFVFAFSGVGGDPVLPEPLGISKGPHEDRTPAGGENGYTITIDNPNDEVIDATSISDTLPSGFAYVPSSTFGATEDDPDVSGQTLTWDGPFPVPGGGSITLTFAVNVSDTPGEYDNQASVAFEEGSSSTGPTATIVVENLPNIEKTADDSTSQGGDENGYTISITNPSSDGGGEGEGEGAVLDTVIYESITDELPDGFTYVPGSTTGLTDADPDISGQTLTWDGPFFIASESTGELHFNVIVSETPGEYDNEASADTEVDSLSTGPTATITVEEPASIEKEADSATSEVGTQNGYTIFVTNPTEESDIVALDTVTYDSITDTLPAGFTYVPGSTTGLTTDDPDVSGQTLTWTGPFSIPSETTDSLHFNVTVAGTPGQYLNNASVHEGDSELATGPTASIDVTAAPLPPLGPPAAPALPCDPITAEGGPGGDRMVGSIGPDRIRSLAGRDIVDAGAGNDEICGGDGGDFLYGRADSDIIRGEGGNDRLFGGLHPDTLYGDGGHDALIGGKGGDTFFTQDGVKDCIMTGKGSDTVNGDVGLDLVDPRGGCPPGF